MNDFPGVLEPSTRNHLEDLLARIDREFRIQFALVVMQDLGGEDPTEYANRLFEAWGVGSKESERGVLILDAVQERYFRVEVGYGLEGTLPDGKVGAILDREVIPHLKTGRRDLAYVAAIRSLTVPVLSEMGKSSAALDSLIAASGASLPRSRGRTSGDSGLVRTLPVLLLLLLSFWFRGRGRRSRHGAWLGGPGLFGGFGSFGGGGWSSGGGFGGFGGGMSGGGGAGRGY